jgi:sialate O-acetylesterase
MRLALWSTGGAGELFQSGGADIPGMRLFAMPEIINELDADLPIKGWQACTKENSTSFSAVAWYFARDLKAALGDVPVGINMSARGGTPAEAWMDPAFAADCKPFIEYADSMDREYRAKFANFEDYKAAYIQYRKDWQAFIHKKSTKNPVEPKGPYFGQRAGGLYGTMIDPILPYYVRGVIWYQGEGNAWHAYDYRFVLETLIRNWRRDFMDTELPFLVVQLPGFGCGNAEHPIWAVMRDSQAAVAAADPNVGVIPIPDLGDETDIHPLNKRPVGSRLARYASGQVYGNDIQFTGPSLDSVQFRGGKAMISLKDAEELIQRGEVLHGFTIAGADAVFVLATAELKGEQLVVSSPEVTAPAAVRYHWSNWIAPEEVNVFNGTGLPLAPFRTDTFKVITQK